MNDILQKIILGIIQGLTEFLPVSSSGHLEIAKKILGDQSAAEQSMMTTVILHLATALATMFVFRNDIVQLIGDGLFKRSKKAYSFIFFIFISMLPAAVVGLFFEDQIEALFAGNLLLVGCCLLLTALLLLLADKQKDTNRGLSGFRAFVVGIAQAIAIMPGVSRSGATISASVLLKIDRTEAARFSFLMVVPLIFGKIGLDLIDGDLRSMDINFVSLLAGFISAFITGVLACKLMIKLVAKSQLKWFSIYCSIVGIGAIVYVLLK